MDFFTFLFWTVVLGVSLEAWRLHLKYNGRADGGSHRRRRMSAASEGGGGAGMGVADLLGFGGGSGDQGDDISDDSSTAERDLAEELVALRARIEVLEAIVTDRGTDLKRQIDDLERRG